MKNILPFLFVLALLECQSIAQDKSASLSGKLIAFEKTKSVEGVDEELVVLLKWKDSKTDKAKTASPKLPSPQTLKYSKGKFSPPLLSLQVGQKVVLENGEKEPMTFVHYGFADEDCFVLTLKAGQKKTLKFSGISRPNEIRVVGKPAYALFVASDTTKASLADKNGKFKFDELPPSESIRVYVWKRNEGYLKISGKKRRRGLEVPKDQLKKTLQNFNISWSNEGIDTWRLPLVETLLEECYPGRMFSDEEFRIEYERCLSIRTLFSLTTFSDKKIADQATKLMKEVAKLNSGNERAIGLFAKAMITPKKKEKNKK